MKARMCQRRFIVYLALFLAFPLLGFSAQPDIQEIVRRSLAVTKADWEAEPHFSHIEPEDEAKGGSRTVKTYEVLIICGSPYNRLIAVNDEPLSPFEAAQQAENLREEIEKRAHETPRERAKRLARYQKDRHRMFELMSEMVDAFNFRLIGEEKLEGRDVFALEVTPRPGYQPMRRETKILAGMRGELWIDKEDYQWVKVQAEVSKPVWFGWFIAKVGPGTSFLLEQAPVLEKLWLPSHFRFDVKATVLWMHKAYVDDETYKDYKFLSSLSTP